ncbi:MAG TPA: Ig-like domain-containing protein, partial [Mycobacterium sp.]|nr:Ig-like domain-containing protein [Mycobacterium sp.]
MSPADPLPPISRRRALTALAVGVVAPGTLAACVGRPGTTSGEATAPAAPSMKYEPAVAATDVSPTAAVGVEVTDGWFQRVALTNPDGKVVAGTLNRDRTAFTVTEPLGYGVEYTWGGSVVGRDGKAVPVAGSFTTINPDRQVSGQFQLADGQVVGVAAPIIIQFDASISDKASVEKALKVTTDPPVEGSWAWLPDEVWGSRVHWRTREYYPAGTKVNVDARLYGVPFGDGAYGA